MKKSIPDDELRITNYELRITNYELRITNYELRMDITPDFKSIYEFAIRNSESSIRFLRRPARVLCSLSSPFLIGPRLPRKKG